MNNTIPVGTQENLRIPRRVAHVYELAGDLIPSFRTKLK
jgi:hypothetical protein